MQESLEEQIRKAEATVELTEQEKNMWFSKPVVEDMIKKDLAQTFANFTLPAQDEGFDEIRYEWQSAESCAEYMKAWVKERKLTQRVEDLQPGSWFREQWNEWTELLQNWRKIHDQWKDSPKQRPAKKRRMAGNEESDEALKEKKKEAEEKNDEGTKEENNGNSEKEIDEEKDEGKAEHDEEKESGTKVGVGGKAGNEEGKELMDDKDEDICAEDIDCW